MKENRIYYDSDADLIFLQGKTVGIIGYGIQGRAHALNLRDCGINLLTSNRKDEYIAQIIRDGFKLTDINELVRKSDIVFLLIPDQAQPQVYKEYIKDNLRAGAMLVFAHGYTLRYDKLEIPNNVDVVMLAPRMPGKQIRTAFLKGEGVPAFIDVVYNRSGTAMEILLALAKAVGFTKVGVLEVDYKIEAELDLFVEQFLVPAVIRAIHVGFNVLVTELKYPAVPTLMELYASGELAEVLKVAALMGIGRAFQKNSSPTCQYGIAANFKDALKGDPFEKAKFIIERISDGTFEKALNAEGNSGYPAVQELWDKVNTKLLIETQEWINNSFRFRPE